MVQPGYLPLEMRYGIGPHQIDGATAEAAAGHARAVDSLDAQCGIHQEIQLVATHFVIVLQAAVGRFEELAHALHGASRHAATNCTTRASSVTTWRARRAITGGIEDSVSSNMAGVTSRRLSTRGWRRRTIFDRGGALLRSVPYKRNRPARA